MTTTSNSVMEFNVFLRLTESEAEALNALVIYGHKNFLEVFYERLGKAYMQPHEKGLISLFENVKAQIPPHLNRIKKTKETFIELNPNKPTT